MAEREVPEVWWSPLDGGLMVKTQDGRMRFLDLTGHDPVDLPEDAVRLAPSVPARDVPSLLSRVGALIDEVAFADDDRDRAHQVAQALLDGGWLDNNGVFGPPEPVAKTLRRIIADLESEAVSRCPVGICGVDIDPVEISHENRVQAETLREYADRLRGHPVLKSEPPPLPDSETEWGCRDRHGQVHSTGVENERQARAMRSMTPVRREVGPWTEPTPPARGAVGGQASEES